MNLRSSCRRPTQRWLSGVPLAAFVILAWTYASAMAADPAEDASHGLDWAKERQFWSFQPPLPQPQPAVKDKRWPAQRLDYFVLARLEEKRLRPSREADRRTLLRRVTFDLTGLPPTPEEIDSFLRDNSPRAYERVVDRLLASPRFGERMASLWLPLARYGEDQAHQVGSDTKFFYPNAHKYREWVIDAFNRDLPYDQFIELQLAADRIESTNSPNLAALGFLGLGPKYYNRNRLEVMADEWDDRVDTVTRTFLGLTVSCSRCHDHKFDPITREDYYAMAGVFASTRMVNRRPDGKTEDNKTEASKMDPQTLHIIEDGEPRNLNVFLRGNVERKGPVVERRFLRVLSESDPSPFTDGSGRKELAERISSPENPLTSRVMVNRVWGAFFGQPLVASASNFGHSGEAPSNPALLDDLAVRFIRNGWSLKTIVREMALSSTYRQRSEEVPSHARIDPANERLSHMPRRRLSVEQWRDAVLFASGRLDFSPGPSLELDDPANLRRTVQARVSRLKLNDLLMLFDYPDANVHAEKRTTSTTATQKLFLLNSPFIIEQAKAFASRIAAISAATDSDRLVRTYEILFARKPSRSEAALALDFLAKPADSEMSRWEQFSQLLFASNEFLYVD